MLPARKDDKDSIGRIKDLSREEDRLLTLNMKDLMEFKDRVRFEWEKALEKRAEVYRRHRKALAELQEASRFKNFLENLLLLIRKVYKKKYEEN